MRAERSDRRALLAVAVVAAALLAAAALTDPADLWARTVAFVMETQRDLHRQLAAAVRAVQDHGAVAAWGLVGLGFLYGVFHAAGPGHGKAVIATYLATHENRLGRGLALAVASSLLQGTTAVALVAVAAAVLDLSMRETQGAAVAMETVSYGLVILLGLFLAVRAGRRLLTPAVGRRHHRAGHEAGAAACGGCGHAHPPSTARDAAATVLSVGCRPCSGAIIVLVLATAMGLLWAGIAAVFAMSVGTALTVSVLAAMSVYARKTAIALAGILPAGAARRAAVGDGVAVLGGLLIAGLGVALLQASRTVAQHPLF